MTINMQRGLVNMNIEYKLIEAFSPQNGWIKEVYNDTLCRTKYDKNEIRVYENGVCEIDVYDSFGNYKDTSYFSEEDLDVIKDHKWYEDNTGYLSTTIDGKKVRMHRLLFPNSLSDHYDSNKLNNTRSNLQQIPHSVNIAKITNRCFNPNGVTGIFFTRNNTWQASIEVNKKRKTKNFKNKSDAILMRFIWELNEWGINAPQLQKIKEYYPRLVSGILKHYKINEDIELVKNILEKLQKDPHCPCRLIKSNDTICMCREFREQEEGECHCGLYVKIKEE